MLLPSSPCSVSQDALVQICIWLLTGVLLGGFLDRKWLVALPKFLLLQELSWQFLDPCPASSSSLNTGQSNLKTFPKQPLSTVT